MQVLVIGAGVVGLAIARQAALAGHDVIVAEATGGIGNGVSSRNSEVIHAGMYYPTGSLRARHCVRGRRMLYEFCASHGVPHKKAGKLIVAVDEKQTAKIEGIAKQGEINGVEGLEFLGGNAARAMEPALNCKPAFSHLIYPAPVEGGLGTHVTLDMAGRMRFGPDVEWIDKEHYDVDPRRAASFYASVRTYFPALPDNSLVPDYCGIRPKLTGKGEPAADFQIDGPAGHGLPRLVHLFGIESPGLTSALSIAADVVAQLQSA